MHEAKKRVCQLLLTHPLGFRLLLFVIFELVDLLEVGILNIVLIGRLATRLLTTLEAL